ncbi:YggS family pyridoxal phosphate-dependent enzyme [Salsuginibacillus kocurii]|uniref:YggS family pyridoxal phosphate-dependent enzyme n=1 Tax=Salsuginibacillus kocurii TaxID=427078 RepID=UPI00037902FF|nr:YggS family pyridoxal phosphate-dependent enzyme [Salsuginibacillus kocurii]
MSTVATNLSTIKERLSHALEISGRTAEEVEVIAVTKYVSSNRAYEAWEAGIKHFGENRVDEAMNKYNALEARGTWHFVGQLQSKKAKKIIPYYNYIHSLDRLSLAEEINKRMPPGEKMKCLVQVNVSGERTKTGLAPADLEAFIEQLKEYPALEISGLMTMAPFVEYPEEVRPFFKELRQLRDIIATKQLAHAPCHHLSMGMSNDFEIAVEEGATMVRLGQLLVGQDVSGSEEVRSD